MRHDPNKWHWTTDDSSADSILCDVLLKFRQAMLSWAIWLRSAKVNDTEGQPRKAESNDLPLMSVQSIQPSSPKCAVRTEDQFLVSCL
jgi:hypothetical protein